MTQNQAMYRPLEFSGGVSHHNGALRRPYTAGADTKEDSGEDDKSVIGSMVIAQVGGDVDAVSNSTTAKSQLNAEFVRYSAGEEANDGDSSVGSGVGASCGLSSELAGASQTVDGVKHPA